MTKEGLNSLNPYLTFDGFEIQWMLNFEHPEEE